MSKCPTRLSQARIAQRWRQSYEGAVVTGDGLGGRWVPSVYARDVFNGPDGRSRSQESAAALAASCPAVVRYRRFWTEAENTPMRMETDKGRFQRGGDLVDHSLITARTRSATSLRHQHPANPAPRKRARPADRTRVDE